MMRNEVSWWGGGMRWGEVWPGSSDTNFFWEKKLIKAQYIFTEVNLQSSINIHAGLISLEDAMNLPSLPDFSDANKQYHIFLNI